MPDVDLKSLKRHPSVLRLYQSRVKLQKENQEYVGLCPFRAEKSGSFRVFQNEGAWIYKCFGCGAKGSIIDFFSELDKIDIKEAIRKVNEYVNGKETSWSAAKESVDKNFKPFAEETKTYTTLPLAGFAKCEQALADSPQALAWIKSRGIDYETAKKLHWGFRQSLGSLAGEKNRDIADAGWMVFPCVSGDKILSIKYRSIARKVFTKQPGMATVLYNTEAISPMEPVYVTEGECLLGDTEVLTPEGWVRLDQYNGQRVAQWYPTIHGPESTFTVPIAYIKKEYCGPILTFSTKTNLVNQAVTPEHRMVYENSDTGLMGVDSAYNVARRRVCFYRTADLLCEGVDLSDDEIRLQVMIQADASLENQGSDKKHHRADGKDGWKIEVSKERKIKRIKQLLSSLHIEYTEYTPSRGTFLCRFRTPAGRFSKKFPAILYTMNTRQRRVFINEIPRWDSHTNPAGSIMYSSVIKENADLIQTVFSVSGLSAKIGCEYRENKQPKYWVHTSLREKRGRHEVTSGSTIRAVETTHSGYVYCLTVPTSFLIIRREGAITVTGNCDAAVLEQSGFRTISLQSSSTRPSPEMKDEMLLADQVILAGDTDVSGAEAMSKLWSELQDRTFLLKWPAGMKDANQTLTEYCKGDREKFRKLVDELTNVAKSVPMPHVFSLQETMMSANRTNLAAHPNRMRFPWPRVDKMAIILPGGMCNWMATGPKMGKTGLILQATMYMARYHNEVVLNYQCELSPEEISTIVTAQTLKKDRNHLTAADHQEAARRLAGVKYYIGRDPTLNTITPTLDLIEAAIRRLGVTTVVLDHIHYVCRNEDNEVQAQANASQRFKNMMVRYGTKGIVVGQPRKATQQSKGKVVGLSDWKGSETGGSDTDAMFAIHRETVKVRDETTQSDYDPKTEIHLLAARSQGDGGTFAELMFMGKIATFEEMSKEEPPPAFTRPGNLV